MSLKAKVFKKGDKHPSPSIAGAYVDASKVESQVESLIAARERLIKKWEFEYGKPIDEQWVKNNCSLAKHILEGDAVIIVWTKWGDENEFGVETP